ncbi:two-component sensor histidine kinase [Streptomyces spiroverticillatus]|uniref:histidine kinase n=1 Tax=Streptomyces finlayi TaxID=67296 RepID=A0A919CEI0_9ACTN|nr:HAMP domain-containing sensor histidine kinase [Streptomyces finlayi]GHA40091.1 two-component sensor histidine kinase [Streptomyces spiroverticillatus]GHD15706.1 two-component sensor histidine kinase [Streptomyces finlayi]
MTPRPVRRVRAFVAGLSLRWKIAALPAAGAALVALAIGVLIHQARTAQVAETARESAIAELYRVRQLYELTGHVNPQDTGSALDSPEVPPALDAAARAGSRNTYLDLSGPNPSVWAARPIGDQVLSVRLPLGAQRAEINDLDRSLVVWGAVVVGLAALGGAALASRLSRRLRTAAATARRISNGDLDARIALSHDGPRATKDEVAELSAALNTMAASLQRRIETEQRFTADVAHELRTPLTGLQTAAELLPASRPTELVRDRVAALRTLTEDLLEVARLDSHTEEPELAAHPLGRLVRSLVDRLGCVVELTAPDEDTYVRTDARRLERILTNLLVNARRHGADPVGVHVDGPCVVIRDHGPGFPEKLLTEGPQRFLTGAAERGQGSGLGLTIAFGQARAIGARVELSNHPVDGGAVVRVTLPEARREG